MYFLPSSSLSLCCVRAHLWHLSLSLHKIPLSVVGKLASTLRCAILAKKNSARNQNLGCVCSLKWGGVNIFGQSFIDRNCKKKTSSCLVVLLCRPRSKPRKTLHSQPSTVSSVWASSPSTYSDARQRMYCLKGRLSCLYLCWQR